MTVCVPSEFHAGHQRAHRAFVIRARCRRRADGLEQRDSCCGGHRSNKVCRGRMPPEAIDHAGRLPARSSSRCRWSAATKAPAAAILLRGNNVGIKAIKAELLTPPAKPSTAAAT